MEALRFTWPCRVIIVGGSCSGKTYLVRQMIERGDLGVSKEQLEIIVASPVLPSLRQDIWKDLRARGYAIKMAHLGQNGFNTPARSARRLLLVVDDVDHVTQIRRGREWLLDLFGTESHHSDISVILIAHHLRIGCPAIKASADAIIVCGLPPQQLKQTAKELGLSPKEEEDVMCALADPAGAVSPLTKNHFAVLFNHVIVWRRPLFMAPTTVDGPASLAPSLYRLPRNIRDNVGMAPI